jgi:hypothetical protein
MLRASVVSVGVGLAFMPIVFIEPSELPFVDQAAATNGSDPEAIEWPAPPAEPSIASNILYWSQVQEAATLRTQARNQSPSVETEPSDFHISAFLLAFGLGVIIVVTLLPWGQGGDLDLLPDETVDDDGVPPATP